MAPKGALFSGRSISMGHRVNIWIQRLLGPIVVVGVMVLRWTGFTFLRTVVILVPFLGILTVVMVLVDPGPRAKGFVEGLKTRFR